MTTNPRDLTPEGGAPPGEGLCVDVVQGGRVRLGGVDLGAVAAALAGVPGRVLEDLGAREATEVLARASVLRSALAAVEDHAIMALDARLRETEAQQQVPEPRRGRATAHHVTMASRLSPAVASRRVAAARRLTADMPRTHRALAEGTLPEASALAIGTTSGPLGPGLRGEVDGIVVDHLPYLQDASVRQWEQEIDLIAHRLDPGSFARRHRRAHADRSVSIVRGAHGMGRLHATLSGIDAAAIGKKLSVAAERLRAQGDRRGHGQAMADLLADTLLGRDEAMDPVRLDVGVVVSDRVLLAGRQGDAVIEGYGTIPSGTALASITAPRGVDGEVQAILRRLYTHPGTGELVAVESRARAFPVALARVIRMGQAGCMGPFCGAPIRHIDHIQAFADGGATSLGNGAGLCAHCNWTRELMARVRASRGDDGSRVVQWTSSLGVITRRTGTPLQGRHRRSRLDTDAGEPPTSPPTATGPAETRGQEVRTGPAACREFGLPPDLVISCRSIVEVTLAALVARRLRPG